MTWEELAAKIAAMPEEARKEPVRYFCYTVYDGQQVNLVLAGYISQTQGATFDDNGWVKEGTYYLE